MLPVSKPWTQKLVQFHFSHIQLTRTVIESNQIQGRDPDFHSIKHRSVKEFVAVVLFQSQILYSSHMQNALTHFHSHQKSHPHYAIRFRLKLQISGPGADRFLDLVPQVYVFSIWKSSYE